MPRVPLTPALERTILNSSHLQQDVRAYLSKHDIEAEEAQREVAQRVANTFYRKDGTPKNTRRMSKEPGRPLARYLEDIGVREKGSNLKVGETPKKKRRRR